MAIEMSFICLSTSYINDMLLYRQTALYLVLLVDVSSFLKEQLDHSFVPILRCQIERCVTILHKGSNEAIVISMLPKSIYMNQG